MPDPKKKDREVEQKVAENPSRFALFIRRIDGFRQWVSDGLRLPMDNSTSVPSS